MEEKNVKDELWTLYEQAKESDDLETALTILAVIERGSFSLSDDRRK